MIRVADYIAQTLVNHGVHHIFLVTGGGAMHLNDERSSEAEAGGAATGEGTTGGAVRASAGSARPGATVVSRRRLAKATMAAGEGGGGRSSSGSAGPSCCAQLRVVSNRGTKPPTPPAWSRQACRACAINCAYGTSTRQRPACAPHCRRCCRIASTCRAQWSPRPGRAGAGGAVMEIRFLSQ